MPAKTLAAWAAAALTLAAWAACAATEPPRCTAVYVNATEGACTSVAFLQVHSDRSKLPLNASGIEEEEAAPTAWQPEPVGEQSTAAPQVLPMAAQDAEQRARKHQPAAAPTKGAQPFTTLVAALLTSVFIAWFHRWQEALPTGASDAAGEQKEHSYLLDNARVVASYAVLCHHLLGPFVREHSEPDYLTWLSDGSPAEPAAVRRFVPPRMPLFCFISGVLSQGPPTRKRVRSFLLFLVFPSIMWAWPIGRVLQVASWEPSSLAKLYSQSGLWGFVRINWYLSSLIIWRCMAFLFFHRVQPTLLLLTALAASCVAGYFMLGGKRGEGNAFCYVTSMPATMGFLPYYVAGYVSNFNGLCHQVPSLDLPWRLISLGVVLWLPYSSTLVYDNHTDPHLTFAEAAEGAEFGWLFGCKRVIRFGFDMLAMGLLLLLVLPRSQVWFSWIGPHTLYPYLLHKMFFHWRAALVAALPLPVLNSKWEHVAVYVVNCLFMMAVQVLCASWVTRWLLQPIFKPTYLTPIVDLLVKPSVPRTDK